MSSELSILKNQAAKAKAALESGLGRTNKPLSKKFKAKLQQSLIDLENQINAIENKTV